MKKSITIWQCMLSLCLILGANSFHAAALSGSYPVDQVGEPANISLVRVIGELESRFKVSFLYKTEVLKTKFVPSSVLEAQDLGAILNEITSLTGLNFEQTGKAVYTILERKSGNEQGNSKSFEQNPDSLAKQAVIQVKGTVLDEAGAALPGAAVMIMGTQKGVISGLDGSDGKVTFEWVRRALREVPTDVAARTELERLGAATQQWATASAPTAAASR
jgi:hypothetical protein